MTKPDALPFLRILLINTTEKDTTVVVFIDDAIIDREKKPVRAQELQTLIETVLDRHNCSISNLSAVAVLEGPGSFTGTRIGVTTANTMHWLRHLPILAIPGSSTDEAIEILTSNQELAVTTHAKVRYS